MSIEEILINLLSDIAPIYPNSYDGGELIYITFNYSEIPTFATNDLPMLNVANLQIHLFAPLRTDVLAKKTLIRKRLTANGFTAPYIENATDEESQHYVFECQYSEGADVE